LRQIRWSVPAAEDLERDNPEAARRVVKATYEGCERLKDFAYVGRASIRLPGRRELIFPHLPYIVVYKVTDTAVEISRIYHGAQDWP